MSKHSVRRITKKEAKEIIHERQPRGLFLELEGDGSFTAIDNSNGDAWTENFPTEQLAHQWLNHEIYIDHKGNFVPADEFEEDEDSDIADSPAANLTTALETTIKALEIVLDKRPKCGSAWIYLPKGNFESITEAVEVGKKALNLTS